ncbi:MULTISPECIES: ArsR/SmtB family transcription factor [Caproicibacterium]|uniref:Helix-turn-helix domain-containing protein n=1 Tax=Caproicibacterium argilliputei TaxID=3030016 RepID=A0AA97H1S7_9FIRM|nr:helix-turn-helix domain-containing protein [Caproicibacterium argilliputei]WOC31607.1 helix-turn-helix domain-containing protein [Caproicibacterium argilliputei]
MQPMGLRILEIQDEESLKIYMDPLRQRIVLKLAALGVPVTAKKLADLLEISPSSAKHHLQKLQGIGLVEVDHTELIHGIVATFYRATPVEVHIGLENDTAESRNRKQILGENMVRMVYHDYFENALAYAAKSGGAAPVGSQLGVGGVLYLSPEEMETLSQKVMEFVRAHSSAEGERTVPIEYSLIAFDARGKTE